MDNFHEEIAVRRHSGLYTFAYFLSWFMLVVSGLIGLTNFSATLSSLTSGQFSLVNLIAFVVFGGMAFLLWRYKDELRVEYEYSFTNGDLDVAKVLNNSRRKYLTALSLKTVEAAGSVSDAPNAFQRYLSMKDVKKHNWFLNRDASLYFFYFTKNSVKHLIVLELSDEMIGLVQKAGGLGFGVWQKA